jgi:hypothetical protein
VVTGPTDKAAYVIEKMADCLTLFKRAYRSLYDLTW